MNTNEEILIDLIDNFVNEKGLWNEWKEFVQTRGGYTLKELGFNED